MSFWKQVIGLHRRAYDPKRQLNNYLVGLLIIIPGVLLVWFGGHFTVLLYIGIIIVAIGLFAMI